jgi:hypothetical protein
LRPTQAKKKFLKQIPNDALQGIIGAAFDTRLTDVEIEVTAVIAFFVHIYGYTASPIENGLKKKGRELVFRPA